MRLIAYYANLLLISSFLGLGIGALLAGIRRGLFESFFAPLLMLDVLLLLALGSATLPVGSGELRFQHSEHQLISYLMLILVFAFNSLTFVPLGQEIGIQFRQLPALRAYAYDLGGSLCGTVAFALFSILCFSPLLGMAVVAVIALALKTPRQRLMALPFYLVALGAMLFAGERGAFWSPYHFITISENYDVKIERLADGSENGIVLDRPFVGAPQTFEP